MLVLSRKVGEKIVIGDRITVVLVKNSEGRASIGIEAPKETPIVRSELVEREREKR